MKNEVKYLREHLREIYQYKSSMADLTYDMPLELLSRCCIAFDYLQKELQRKDNIINSLEKWLNENNLYNTNDNILKKLNELKEKV